MATLPIFALIAISSIEENFPCSLAATNLFASTSPNPVSEDNGGLIPSSSTKNFFTSDL